MPTRTMLQHYVQEVMRRAVFTPLEAHRVSAHVPEIPEMTAEGENERDAEHNLSAMLVAWLALRLANGQTLPIVGGIDLNSEQGQHMLAVEHGLSTQHHDSEQPMKREDDADQAWFWSPEWQEKERQADADLEAGRFQRFESGAEFLAALRARRRTGADV